MKEMKLLNYKYSHINAHPFFLPQKMIGPKENPLSCQRGIMDRNVIKRREGNGQPCKRGITANEGERSGVLPERQRGRFEQLP